MKAIAFVVLLLVSLASSAYAECRCQGCGCKGGPGWRDKSGRCVSHSSLIRDCGTPPSTRCTYEGARQVCAQNSR